MQNYRSDEIGRKMAEVLEKDYWTTNLEMLKERDNTLYCTLENAQENMHRKLYLDWTRTGEPTLLVEDGERKVRLCSSRNPVREGELFAQGILVEEATGYVVFGMAMGYHVDALAKLTNTQQIVVLENDIEQLAICMRYRNLSTLLSQDRIKIVYCKEPGDYVGWLDADEEAVRYCMWEPSIKTIQNKALREILENYKVLFDSMDKLGDVLMDNFYHNQQLSDENVDVLRSQFEEKTIILLAGGPSLDEHIDTLRQLAGRSDIQIVCVGKVARRVLRAGVRPDYIVMIDGKAGTRWQINGIEDCGIPLIYLSTVAAKVAAEYQGKRYIAYQSGIEEAQAYATEHGYTVYQSGGSVSTFAIDMGLRMKCSRIICVGLDMGYKGDSTHAGNVGRKIVSRQTMRQVEGVDDTMIYTSKTLDMYRGWIERHIEKVKDVELINASGGARIHGMKEMSLEEIF